MKSRVEGRGLDEWRGGWRKDGGVKRREKEKGTIFREAMNMNLSNL